MNILPEQTHGTFEAELRQRNESILFWAACIFNTVYVLWTAFDYYLAREHWLSFLVLRVSASAINTALVFAALRWFRRRTFETFWVWFFVFGVFVVPMLSRVEDSFLAYVMGFTVVILGVTLVPIWSPRWAVTNILAILAAVPVAFILSPPRAPTRDLVAGLFFVSTASVIGLVMNGFKYSLLRRVFESRQELRQTQLVSDALREADRLKDEFLANVSHELRTPLNGIIGLSESMLDGAAGRLSSPQRLNLTMIATSGRRLATLVGDILDFSRLKNRQVNLVLRPTEVRSAVDVVLALLAPLAAGKKLRLVNDVDARLPAALADEDRLQQILVNLVGNSIKFTEEGTITVSAEARPGDRAVAITVADTGIGISEEKHEAIFESFQQVEPTLSREHAGTGLGLTITRQLVELHGGTIEVRSRPGEGAAFTFTLPLSDATSGRADAVPRLKLQAYEPISDPVTPATIPMLPASTPKTDPALTAAPSTGARILVVDDEPVNLQVISNYLVNTGYRVATASNGAEALEWIQREGRPDVVLLDLMMPKMSGYEALKRIRARHSATELPVILLSARNQVSDLVQGFEAGASDYLSKPISKGELLARLRTHLQLSRLFIAYGRFVPHEFIQHLERENILEVGLGDQVQKEMAVLFADIRSFTALSENMTPAETFNFLNSFLSRVAPVIAKNHGFIDKYIGDAVMALFPGSVAHAVSAAADLRQAVRLYNAHRQASGYRPIRVGIGVHAGPLILGTIGYEERMQTTVIADSVNLASRLEGLTKLFGVDAIVSADVLSRVPSEVAVRSLGRIQVKGKTASIETFELLEGAPDDELSRRLRTRETFETGIRHLVEGNAAAAALAFERVLVAAPEDVAAEYMLHRALSLTDPPDTPGGVDRRSSAR